MTKKQQAGMYDVLIAGGGLAGSSLGCALAQAGLRCCVLEAVSVDADDQPSFDERTIALTWGSRLIFSGLGVWSEIAAADAEPIHSIHVSRRGGFGMCRLDSTRMGVKALGYVVPTRVLGRVLLEQLRGTSGLDYFCPARAEVVQVAADHVFATVVTEQGRVKLQGRLLVVADGGRSTLREQLGYQVFPRPYRASVLLTTVSTEQQHRGRAFERFTEHGPLALLPMSQNRYAVVWTLPQAQIVRLQACDDAEFLAQLQADFGYRAGIFAAPGARLHYPLARTRVAPLARQRSVLLGNAAHLVHPVAGQGFNLGLRDVAHLAEVLRDVRQRGEDPGSDQVLQKYSALRRVDTRRVQGMTHGLMTVFTQQWPGLSLARQLGLVAVDMLPPVQRWLLRNTMGLVEPRSQLSLGLPLTRFAGDADESA